MDESDKMDPDWAQEIEDVQPLKGKHKAKLALSDYIVESHDDDDDDVREAIPHHLLPKENIPQNLNYNIPISDEVFNNIQHTEKTLSGCRVSISPDHFKKLKKGAFAIEGRLDLHGFKEDQAWQGLNDFLNETYQQNKRCVLIVHGKGKGYGDCGNMGIIKANICQWLQNSPYVLAYHTAQGKHGGSGAVYVLMRKNKHK